MCSEQMETPGSTSCLGCSDVWMTIALCIWALTGSSRTDVAEQKKKYISKGFALLITIITSISKSATSSTLFLAASLFLPPQIPTANMKFTTTTISTVLALATFAIAAPQPISESDLQIIKDIQQLVEGADKIRGAADNNALERRACNCEAYKECRRRCGTG